MKNLEKCGVGMIGSISQSFRSGLYDMLRSLQIRLAYLSV